MTDSELLIGWAKVLEAAERERLSPKGAYGIRIAEEAAKALAEQLREIAGRISDG